jgi:hypothetical protein
MKFEERSTLSVHFSDVLFSECSTALCYNPFISLFALGRQTSAKSPGAAVLVACSTEYGRTYVYVAAEFVFPCVGSSLASCIQRSSRARSSTGYP